MRAETVLVIEDDPAIATIFDEVLHEAGFSITLAQSGSEALKLAATAEFALILLDLALPDTDGLILLGRLRGLTSSPIVVCSARSHQVDRVIALKIGADDFIAKPFDVEELNARIYAVLRRSHTSPATHEPAPDVLRVGQLVVAPSRATATVNDHPLQLTPTEYRLLVHLARNQDQVLSRRALAGALWGYADKGTDHMIDVHIGRIRTKIRAVIEDPMIITARGAGYSLTARSGERSTYP